MPPELWILIMIPVAAVAGYQFRRFIERLDQVVERGEFPAPNRNRCTSHRSFNQCELAVGHDGKHKTGGLTWD
jgi:hypothetical protein